MYTYEKFYFIQGVSNFIILVTLWIYFLINIYIYIYIF